MRPLILALALCFSACSSPAETSDRSIPETEGDVRFSDVLAEYQDLNRRLENVAAPILTKNAQLCPVTERSIGMTVHTVSDYPDELQPVAETLLDVSTRLSIRTIRDGSPSDLAGLKPGDEIVRIGTHYFPSGDTVQLFYNAAIRDAFDKDETQLSIRRGGELIETIVRPETICGYPVNVFFSENVNGHTDGREVWLTSELLRIVHDDANLALIIAHEMSHAIAGHLDRKPSKSLELEADRMALVMMVRAGYDIDQAISYWQNAVHPHQKIASTTHPSIAERLANFQKSRADIIAKQARGMTLKF